VTEFNVLVPDSITSTGEG